jgi:radical SAM superfamily enzyme YgiQ (UPF0313 family)
MKILLILVAIPELAAGTAGGVPILAPPLTLPVLAALACRARVTPVCLDVRFFMHARDGEWVLDRAALHAAIAASGCELAGVSFMSSAAALGVQVAGECARLGMTVIGGGVHASVAEHELAATGAFHYLVQGEAEARFPALLTELRDRVRPRHPVPAVVLAGGRVDPALIPAITTLAPYESIYAQYEHRVMYVETNRGCYKDCAFCEVARTARGFRPLRKVPLATAMASVAACIEAYGVNYLLVADSVATRYKRHFLEFLALVGENWPEVNVQFNSTVDCWDDDFAAACRGLNASVWFGFESGSQRVLDEVIGKGSTVAQALAAAESCLRHGVPHAFNVLLGLPGETEWDLQQTLRVLERCPGVYPNPNIFTPLPGTRLYRECLERGELRDAGDYSIWDASRIRAEGRGPLTTVDYGRILDYHDRLLAMHADPRRLFMRSTPMPILTE